MRHPLTLIALAATSLVVAASPALAGGHNSSSISLVMLSGASVTTSTASPSFGDQVTFDVATTATDRPYVTLNCYQNGQWLLSGQAGFYAEYGYGQVFTLASSSWTSGAGNCTATVGVLNADGTKFRALASTSFDVTA